MAGTTAPDEYTECAKCHTRYLFCGCVATWTFIGNEGPFCEECMAKGVTVNLQPATQTTETTGNRP